MRSFVSRRNSAVLRSQVGERHPRVQVFVAASLQVRTHAPGCCCHRPPSGRCRPNRADPRYKNHGAAVGQIDQTPHRIRDPRIGSLGVQMRKPSENSSTALRPGNWRSARTTKLTAPRVPNARTHCGFYLTAGKSRDKRPKQRGRRSHGEFTVVAQAGE